MSAARAVTLLASALGRGDWGRAMAAELAHVSGRQTRRRFVAGCLGALVLSLPAVAWVTLAAGLLSLAVVAAALVRYPGLVTGAGTWVALGFFVAVVVGYVVAAVGLSTRLQEKRVLVGAVVAGTGIGCSWLSVGFSASVHVPAVVSMTMLALGPGVAAAAGARAAGRSSWRVGMQYVGLASLLAGFVLFLLWAGATVAFAGRPYDAGLVSDFRASGAHDLATYAVSDSLGSGMMLLLLVPLVSLVAGAVGATVAAHRARAGSPA
jgi:hypothetical protein